MSHSPCTLPPRHREAGFTLIELSIVLVIIGLIVGGVLVGQNLIKAAELRATVSQIEQLNTAVNTFRGKYTGLPGDFAKAATFGLAGTYNGNGNGLLESDEATAGDMNQFAGEIANFWVMLSSANMVGGVYTLPATTTAVVNTSFPGTKLGRGGIIAISSGGFIQYLIGVGDGNVDFSAADSMISRNLLTPLESYDMDSKMDDSQPLTGIARVVEWAAASAPDPDRMIGVTPADTVTSCVSVAVTGAAAQYRAVNESPLCVLMIRAN